MGRLQLSFPRSSELEGCVCLPPIEPGGGGASSSLQRVQSGIRLGPARRGVRKTPCHRVIGPSSGIARDCSGSHKPVDTQAVPGGPKVGARIADLGRWKCGGRTRGGVESCRRAAAGQDREVEKDWRPTAQEEKQQSNEGSAAQRSAAQRTAKKRRRLTRSNSRSRPRPRPHSASRTHALSTSYHTFAHAHAHALPSNYPPIASCSPSTKQRPPPPPPPPTTSIPSIPRTYHALPLPK